MVDEVWFVVTFLTALGCGMVGGLLFAFSTSVMKALGSIPSEAGIAAMQAINITIMNPVFGLFLVGTTLGSIALVIGAITRRGEPESLYMLIGALTYLIGGIGVTGAFNVPRNNALAAVKPAEGHALWQRFLVEWTRWNHVRTVACMVALAFLMIALKEFNL